MLPRVLTSLHSSFTNRHSSMMSTNYRKSTRWVHWSTGITPSINHCPGCGSTSAESVVGIRLHRNDGLGKISSNFVPAARQELCFVHTGLLNNSIENRSRKRETDLLQIHNKHKQRPTPTIWCQQQDQYPNAQVVQRPHSPSCSNSKEQVGGRAGLHISQNASCHSQGHEPSHQQSISSSLSCWSSPIYSAQRMTSARKRAKQHNLNDVQQLRKRQKCLGSSNSSGRSKHLQLQLHRCAV